MVRRPVSGSWHEAHQEFRKYKILVSQITASALSRMEFDTRCQHHTMPTTNDLQKCLLANGSNTELKKTLAGASTTVSTCRLQWLSGATGALIAYMSQTLLILSLFLWHEDDFDRSKSQLFSLCILWSLWTCVMATAGMTGMWMFIYLVEKSVQSLPEATVCTMQACYVFGSLLTIVTTGLYKDFLNGNKVGPHPHPVFLLTVPCYILLLYPLLRTKQQKPIEHKSSDLMITYYWGSAILGLVVGMCWQLESNLERGDEQYLSILWSSSMFFFNCASFLFLLILLPGNSGKTLLRMEATYICSRLVGTSATWIWIDWMGGKTLESVPIVMLILSLTSFPLIQLCPTEEKPMAAAGVGKQDDTFFVQIV